MAGGLAILKTRVWQDVYLGEVAPDGASMTAPHRFTLDNRGSDPNGWTQDSKALIFQSKRSGRSGIFRQNVNENIAAAIVQGPEDDRDATLSPDGSWVLYVKSNPPGPAAPPSPERLMRRPVGGGSPETILEEPAGMSWEYGCPLKRGSSCVLSQKEGNDFVFYALDPVRGMGERLGKIEAAQAGFTGWNISPDGSCLAVVRGEDKYNGRIDLLTLPDRGWRQVSVEPGWGHLQSIAWAAHGRGFFVTSWLPDSFNLLQVSLTSKVKPLLRNGHRQFMHGPLPSPDGRYSNVWMLENF
jgi:hypothetical protein